MIAKLRQLLGVKGELSAEMIDDADGMPTSQAIAIDSAA